MQRRAAFLLWAFVGVVAVPLSACTVNVRESGSADTANVDIRSPVGDVTVRTDVDKPDAGLPVYPGAARLHDGDDPANANVDVGAFGVGVKVVAANYESGDSPQTIVEFYKDAMRDVGGTVVECRGEVDFKDGRAVCSPQPLDREIQLIAGTEQNQHIVVVTPRAGGSKLSLVHVQTRGVN
jgi:hypothetical protein